MRFRIRAAGFSASQISSQIIVADPRKGGGVLSFKTQESLKAHLHLLAIFLQVSVACELLTNLSTGSTGHFVAKQSQETTEITIINLYLGTYFME